LAISNACFIPVLASASKEPSLLSLTATWFDLPPLFRLGYHLWPSKRCSAGEAVELASLGRVATHIWSTLRRLMPNFPCPRAFYPRHSHSPVPRGLSPGPSLSLSDAPVPSVWPSPRLPRVQGRPQPPPGAPCRVARRLAAGTARPTPRSGATILQAAGVCGLLASAERGPERPRRHREQRSRSASGPATQHRRSGGPMTLVGAHGRCRRCVSGVHVFSDYLSILMRVHAIFSRKRVDFGLNGCI
jgi:hypothetical protein